MTTGGEIRGLIVDLVGLNEVYRQAHVPDDAVFPYASFLDPVQDSIGMSGDARTLGRRRMIQVDLWQTEGEEDDTLLDRIVAAIDGEDSASGFHFRVIDAVLVQGPEGEEDIVHHAITVTVARVV